MYGMVVNFMQAGLIELVPRGTTTGHVDCKQDMLPAIPGDIEFRGPHKCSRYEQVVGAHSSLPSLITTSRTTVLASPRIGRLFWAKSAMTSR